MDNREETFLRIPPPEESVVLLEAMHVEGMEHEIEVVLMAPRKGVA